MEAAVKTRAALKEWAAVIQALREGRQILLLRKGGIHEPRGQLPPGPEEFFFFPGFEHQRLDLLKPEYAARYQRFLDPELESGPLYLDTFARLVGDLTLDPPEKAYRLSGHHIWTEEYVRARLEYKPEKPLHLFLIRAYGLARARQLPRAPRYAGCRSWVDLDEELNVEGACAALDEADFIRRAEAVKRLVA